METPQVDDDTDSVDAHYLDYLEKSQKLFQIGNEINTRIDSFKLEIASLQNEFKSEIGTVKILNESLLNRIKTNRNNKRKQATNNNENASIDQHTNISDPEPKIIVETEPEIEHIEEQIIESVVDACVNTDFIDTDQDELMTPVSPSVIKKKSPIVTRQVEKASPKLSEEEAFKKLMAMMEEDKFEVDDTPIVVQENTDRVVSDVNGTEPEAHLEVSSNGSNDVTSKSPKLSISIGNDSETKMNTSSNEESFKSSKASTIHLNNCEIKLKRLSLDKLDVKLSQESEKLIKNTPKKPADDDDDDESKEDRRIDRMCKLDMDKLFPKPKSSNESSKKPGKTTKEEKSLEKEKPESSSDLFSSSESSDEAEENIMNQDVVPDTVVHNNYEITDDESDLSSINESDSEEVKKKKGAKKKVVVDSTEESNGSRPDSIESAQIPLKKILDLDPDLLFDFKDTDEEDKENSNPKSSKKCKPKLDASLLNIELDGQSGDDTLIEEKEESKKSEKSVDKSDDEELSIISKRRSKRLTSEASDELDKDSDDEIKGSKKTSKQTYLKGIFSSDVESTSGDGDENKENVIELDESSKSSGDTAHKKRKRVRLQNSDSECSVESSKTKAKNKMKKIKKELDYSDSASARSVTDTGSDSDSDSDSDIQSIHSSDEESPNKTTTRHKLRNIIGDEKLTKETLDAIQAERERKKRIEEKRALESSLVEEEREDIYLDVDAKTKKPQVKVDPAISKHLKPHQIEGIKFMWDSCYEKCEMIEEGHKGSGCLLAHCMGLGKTFQVIALVHTLLTNKDLTKCKRVLVLLPVNVLTNWKKEFRKWTKHCKNQITVFEIPNDKGYNKDLTRARLNELENWYKKGGVLLAGYTLFARLVSGKSVKPKKLVEGFTRCLLSGPDLVICDEGHMLKTESTALNKTVSQIETVRRIVLTGTPLQNNLIEYHCMVSFVKPNLLGTIKEFKNRFVNPINNGQHKDSTEADVRYMKKRAHILHNVLDGCVQRKDYSVIRNLLRPKKEYVLSIRLSDKQIDLYRTYIQHRGINVNNFGKMKSAQLFCDYQNLYRVWTHPWVLKLNEVRVIRQEEKLAEQKFVVDDDDDDEELGEEAQEPLEENMPVDDEDDDIVELSVTKPKRTGRKSEINGGGINIDLDKKPPERWWTSLVSDDDEFDTHLSGKLVLLENILKSCAQVGDKLLLFSQSLLSLDLIEKFLEKITLDKKDRWRKGEDYFRMDGQTDIQKRQQHVDRFNDEDNHRARLFLISTRAGGIGINLIGANRCIIFDASWNPSYDTQSIFRIYRFGQNKDVFVYRFLAQGTMEERIYQRQVTKQSLSQRVIDEHQIDRHFTSQEIRELYNFEPDVWDGSDSMAYDIPDDDLLKSLLMSCKRWICKYHEHDSLLENKLNEGLSEEDRKAAWEEYENEKRIQTNTHIFNSEMATNLNNNLVQQSNQNMDEFLNFLNQLHDNEKANNRPTDNIRTHIQNAQREQLKAQLEAQGNKQNDQLRAQDSRNAQQMQQWQQQMQMQNQLQQHLQLLQQQQPNLTPPIQRMQQMITNNQHNLNIRVPAGTRAETDPRPMNNTQYLTSILGAPRASPVNPQLQQGLTLQQQQQLQMQNNLNSNLNASLLINQHRKQIQQQTFSPQQPVSSTSNRQSSANQNQINTN